MFVSRNVYRLNAVEIKPSWSTGDRHGWFSLGLARLGLCLSFAIRLRLCLSLWLNSFTCFVLLDRLVHLDHLLVESVSGLIQVSSTF